MYLEIGVGLKIESFNQPVITPVFKDKMTDTVKSNIESWADAVMGNSEYRFTNKEILHNVEILDAIVKSIDSGKTEKVN